MTSIQIGLLGVVILIALLFMGMHIGMAMSLVGFFGYIAVTGKIQAALGMFMSTPFTTCANFSLSVIPMFTLMGTICFYAGISSELYAACYKLLSRTRGGLSVATIVACAGFGAICGSSTATVASMGVVCMPEMRKYGYKDTLTCGSISAGGTLGILIPPSVAFMLYGINAEVAVGKLFVSGIIPGIILTVLYSLTVAVICRLDPDAGPQGPTFTTKEKIIALKGIFPIIVLFVLVLGGIFFGWTTPSEGGAIGASGAMVFMILRGQFTMKNIFAALKDAVQTSAMIFFIMIGAYIFGYFLTVSRLPTVLAKWVASSGVSPYLVLAACLGIFAALGCFVDALPLIVLLVPIFVPIMRSLSFNLIWFGCLMVFMTQLGLLTPPVGMCCYVMAGMAKDVSLSTVFKGTTPFLIALIAVTVIVIAFPGLATWLPGLMYN